MPFTNTALHDHFVRLGAAPRRCGSGKYPHPSRGAAEAAIRSLQARDRHHPGRGALHPYWCRVCRAYHTGHQHAP